MAATTTKMPRNTRNTGFRISPTQVSIFPGRRDSANVTAKKANAKIHNAACPFSGKNRSMPTVKEVAARRGMAKNGPMVRYSRHEKNAPYFLPTVLLS